MHFNSFFVCFLSRAPLVLAKLEDVKCKSSQCQVCANIFLCVMFFSLFFFLLCLCSGLSFAQMRSVCKGGNGHNPHQEKWTSLCPPAFQRTPTFLLRSSPIRQPKPIALRKTKLWCNYEKSCSHCADNFQVVTVRYISHFSKWTSR